jgi:hypothetical protein
MAAENPKTNAAKSHRNGHGKALRTAIRGALTVNLRRSKRNLMGNGSG